jgi:TolB-like protein
MEVLVCLAEFAGETVPKEDLIQKVWPNTFVTDDVLTRAISELRRVFEDDARGSRVIQTIPKRGYRLLAPVNGALPAASPETRALEVGADSARGESRRLWPAALGIGGAILLVTILATADRNWIRERFSGGKTPPIHSLAVLPLQNLSGDPKQEYFADAMTEELITELSRISALNVISRTSVMRYKGSDKPLPAIARELGADAIIEGSVLRSGDRVRITAQLIYASKDTNLWAQTYDRDLQDVLTLQSVVAGTIAKEIQVRVAPQEKAHLRNLRPVNRKALDAYIEAQFHMDQAAKLEYYKGKAQELREEFDKGVASLDHAIQEDPNYMPAYSAYFNGMNNSDRLPSLGYLQKAKAALTKALQLDDTDVAAHLALARLLQQYEYDWAGAEREYKKAIELQPNSGDAHAQYSDYLFCLGRNTERDRELNLAQALDPSHDYFADAGVHRLGSTVDEDRLAVEEKAPNDPLSLGVLGKDYAIAGRYKESAEMYERCVALYGWSDFANVLKRANAKGGAKFALEEWLRAGEEYSKTHDDLSVVPMAFTYSSLGNKDRAFAWLDKAYEQRNWMIIYLKADPVWDPLRSDPRFEGLLRRAGLPQ